MSDHEHLNFSQRNGFTPIPQQLQLGCITEQFIALTWGAVYQDFRKDIIRTGGIEQLGERWSSLFYDFHVYERHNTHPATIDYSVKHVEAVMHCHLKDLTFPIIMNTIEYLLKSVYLRCETKDKLRKAFEISHLPYRIVDDSTIAVFGYGEQALALENAFDATASSAPGARSHLKGAAVALTKADWSGSVRESITAVEATARILAGDAATLGDALKSLGKNNTINPRLKSAFEKLYAYTNDENGIRHANLYSENANVDEADAMFMLGSCASFVNFLLSKSSLR